MSLIDPPGWTIILIPALIKFCTPSGKGKKASDATMEFDNFFGWNFFAFETAILQLSSLFCWPAPIPIVDKSFAITIALDFTNLQTLKANSMSFSSLVVGLIFETNLED